MAVAVKLWKYDESEDSVAYLFGPDREHVGQIVVDKKTGSVSGESSAPATCLGLAWFFYYALARACTEKMFRAKEYPNESIMRS